MVNHKIAVGQIDIGIHPDLPYLSGLDIRLTQLNKHGYPYFPAKVDKGYLHGSQVASIICGPYYEEGLLPTTQIEAIAIPRLGKTMLCLLHALDMMLATDIRVLCLPIGVNLPTPVFLPFMQALAERGVLVVAPAGNKGKGTVLTPGTYPEVLTVGALNPNENVAKYSGRILEGPEAGRTPDILARGEFPDPAKPNSDKTIHGTSMACAYVAGKAARIWQLFPKATLSEICIKLGVEPSSAVSRPPILSDRYIDRRLEGTLRHLKADDSTEGIIISGHSSAIGMQPFSMSQLLEEVEAVAGCPPLEVNPFSVTDVVHVRAASRFFGALLDHQGLFCAQAVDVSMFDL